MASDEEQPGGRYGEKGDAAASNSHPLNNSDKDKIDDDDDEDDADNYNYDNGNEMNNNHATSDADDSKAVEMAPVSSNLYDSPQSEEAKKMCMIAAGILFLLLVAAGIAIVLTVSNDGAALVVNETAIEEIHNETAIADGDETAAPSPFNNGTRTMAPTPISNSSMATPSPLLMSPTMSPTVMASAFSCQSSLSFLQQQPGNASLPNADCNAAVLVPTDAGIVCGSTWNAPNSSRQDSCFETDPLTPVLISAPHVWYSVQGTGGRIGLSTCHPSTNVDTRIAVYDGAYCILPTCLVDPPLLRSGSVRGEAQPHAANDNDASCLETNSGASTVLFDSDAGVEYKFYVSDTSHNQTGMFGLTATSYTPPSNDLCSNAMELATDGVEVVGTTINATISSTVNSCAFVSNYYGTSYENNIRGAEVWYQVNGTGGRISISTCSVVTNFDTVIAVYANDICSNTACLINLPQLRSGKVLNEPQPRAANDNDSNCYETSEGASTVVFDSVQGAGYKLYVSDNFGRLDGTFGLTATSYVPPANDLCVNAPMLEVNGTTILGTTQNATITSTVDSCAFRSRIDSVYYEDNIRGAEVWYKFTGTGSRVNITTCHKETTFDTVLAVYTNGNCTSFVCLEDSTGTRIANDHDPFCTATISGASTVSLMSVKDQIYKFYVSDKYGRLDGNFGVSVFPG